MNAVPLGDPDDPKQHGSGARREFPPAAATEEHASRAVTEGTLAHATRAGLYCVMSSRPNAKMGHQNRKPSPEILRRLSANVKRLRRAQGYTQQQLATLCGLTKSYISNVEQGTVNISLANLEALAIGLDCSEEDLVRPPPNPRAAKDP